MFQGLSFGSVMLKLEMLMIICSLTSKIPPFIFPNLDDV